MIRAVIADDHLVYRAGIRSVLAAADAEIVIVGEASTGDEAVALVAAEQPDVIFMDVKMPGMNGLEATRLIVENHPGTAVLVLTMFDDDSVVDALAAGARGYLLKDAAVDELVRAVRAVMDGELIVSPAAAQRLGIHLRTPHDRQFPQLTAREADVLRLMARGYGNKQIASMLFLSDKTVRNYTSNIFVKLEVQSRAQAIVRAHDAGFAESG